MKEMIGDITKLKPISDLVQTLIDRNYANNKETRRPVHIFQLDYAWYDGHPALKLTADDFFGGQAAFDDNHALLEDLVVKHEPYPLNLGDRAARRGLEGKSEDFADKILETHDPRFLDNNAYHGTALTAILGCNGELGDCGKSAFNLTPFLRRKLVPVSGKNLRPEREKFDDSQKADVDPQAARALHRLGMTGDVSDFVKRMKTRGDTEALNEIHAAEKDMDEQSKRIKHICDALDTLIDGADRTRIETQRDRPIGDAVDAEKMEVCPGDVIVIPLEVRAEIKPPWVLPKSNDKHVGIPIVAIPEIASRITKLTNQYSVAVVVASGNSDVDITASETTDFIGHISEDVTWERSTFDNNGVDCGATITGQGYKDEDGPETPAQDNPTRYLSRAAHFYSSGPKRRKKPQEGAVANWGACVDAYIDGYVDVTRIELSRENGNFNRQIDGYFWNIFAGSSASTILAAAMLGTVQELRTLLGWQPLKPFEARAHFRQWRNHADFKTGKRDCPPNLLEWLVGTRLVELVDKDQEGQEGVYQLSGSNTDLHVRLCPKVESS